MKELCGLIVKIHKVAVLNLIFGVLYWKIGTCFKVKEGQLYLSVWKGYCTAFLLIMQELLSQIYTSIKLIYTFV